LIAASACIKVNDKILYSFYIGDALSFRPHSPTTLLINGIYRYCQARHYKILDLGISTDKGVLNEGLYAFKKTFGCFDSFKLTFLKQLRTSHCQKSLSFVRASIMSAM
jgi:lipid II:glycine glycyltransferase (peptidoglycan interpeptide bridge formation enzyme)